MPPAFLLSVHISPRLHQPIATMHSAALYGNTRAATVLGITQYQVVLRVVGSLVASNLQFAAHANSGVNSATGNNGVSHSVKVVHRAVSICKFTRIASFFMHNLCAMQHICICAYVHMCRLWSPTLDARRSVAHSHMFLLCDQYV